ncbi:uncharacterized protein LOC133298115 [Gastrolobium bilobum]|uniref:uncharacterized protein LOC133298115 n=1 Tax=Gastrolobium bilobum TaxID=150636 RepID=UPI002AB2CB02|nr:uncharacterized protein LOC133298115 [Gastrolobium bilobum]
MANALLDYLTNPGNPYFLHSGENPALVLVSNLLDGKNYYSWSRAMKMALRSKNKLCFIDGTIPVLISFHGCDVRSLAKMQYDENAIDAWNDLYQRFSQADAFRIADLQEEIYRIQQGERSVSDFYTQIKALWDEFETLQPLPTYTCVVPCGCGLSNRVREGREKDRAIRFLRGLNEQFMNVRSQIMLMRPLPSVNEIFSLVSQQERQQNSESHSELNQEYKVLTNAAVQKNFMTGVGTSNSRNYMTGDESSNSFVPRGGNFFRGRGRANVNGRGRGNRLCTFCGRTNHTVETCFEKHGYPPGFKQRSQIRTANMIMQEAADDGDTKELKNNSEVFSQMQYQRILDMIQSSTSVPNDTHASNLVHADHTSSANATLTHAVAIQPTTFNPTNFNIIPSGNTNTRWVIDTGATDHITHLSSLFSTLTPIKPISITLPNGSKVFAKSTGTIHLTEDLILHNVLFVPDFHMNTRKMIGIAKEEEGLFIIEAPTHTNKAALNFNSSNKESVLWHLRLGHIPETTLKYMSCQFPFIPNKAVIPCEVCHYAKQKKLPFSSSVTKSSHAFELIHVDIWGPYKIPSIQGYRYFLTIVDDYSRFGLFSCEINMRLEAICRVLSV